MADQQLGNIHGVAAAHVGDSDTKTNINGSNVPGAGFYDADQATIDAMRTRLAAISAGEYTAAKLNTMTVNDMAYAIRLNDSPDTIKDR